MSLCATDFPHFNGYSPEKKKLHVFLGFLLGSDEGCAFAESQRERVCVSVPALALCSLQFIHVILLNLIQGGLQEVKLQYRACIGQGYSTDQFVHCPEVIFSADISKFPLLAVF